MTEAIEALNKCIIDVLCHQKALVGIAKEQQRLCEENNRKIIELEGRERQLFKAVHEAQLPPYCLVRLCGRYFHIKPSLEYRLTVTEVTVLLACDL